ncbi:type II inositol 1,4,5-trisphosphate 5-phosphatase-like protein [Euroglyphus maynei]|uniref:Type II inositol 1,4,5-trisphosphate 5-phosphatase-like protein n=1 Tax=Euroglyphus maynei TaxID=6958 RepID=A0A1Y3AYY4_EURMA|nr:type II inositol 1,4,5-trisphosphate 5-phosphatase-like protein [Euroglyphus maynei]
MTSDTDYVKKLLSSQEFDTLLAIDQLRTQMKEKNCFQGFNEGKINHMPSYKYNTGTNEWDSSEKRRPPAWCDRILWRGENIQQTVYRSHPELKDSDHKPVSALFESQVLSIDHKLKRKVYEDVMKKLDKVENELLPQVAIDTTEINFGSVAFKDNNCRVLTLTNIGQSRIRYRFINKPNDINFCKQWLRVTPSTGMIKVKEEITIVFELNFDDPSMVSRFNYGLETLADTLVLSLIGGKDIFITISGDYRLSCFGCSLETLVRLQRPISSMTLREFQEKFGDYKIPKQPDYKERLIDIITESKETANSVVVVDGSLPIPKELFVLIDHLYRNGHVNVNIFQSSGMEQEFLIIRDSLDSSEPNKIANVSEHSVAEALLLFLETLPDSIIPMNFYDRVQRAHKNQSECKQEMCNNSGIDKPLNKLYIGKCRFWFNPFYDCKFFR